MKALKFIFICLLLIVFFILLVLALFFISRESFYQTIIFPSRIEQSNFENSATAWLLGEETTSSTDQIEPIEMFKPAKVIKAVYYGGWLAGRDDFVDKIIKMASTSDLNAVVIDIKDFSGYLSYKTDVDTASQYGAEKQKIKDVVGLVENLHQQGIYVVARLAVFQDPVLAHARPDLAIHSKAKLALLATSTATLWIDNSGLAWLDPSAQEVWQYITNIANDAWQKGFDEINFDYIRFPSDGDLGDMYFPFFNQAQKQTKREVINDFVNYLREQLPQARLSIDIFGYVALTEGDIGIGQFLEDFFPVFDFICPMVYPSHYEAGFLGYQKPAEYPYEVIDYSLNIAQSRLFNFKLTSALPAIAKIRPWLQDFDLGADYTAEMIKKEIKASQDSLADDYNGFMLWNSSNRYTIEVLANSSTTDF